MHEARMSCTIEINLPPRVTNFCSFTFHRLARDLWPRCQLRLNDFLDFHSAHTKNVRQQRKLGDRDPRTRIEKVCCARNCNIACNFECNGFRVMPLSRPRTRWTLASFYQELDEKLFGNFFRIVWFFCTAMHLQLPVKVIVDNGRWVLGKAFLMLCPRALVCSAFQSQDTNAL